MQQKRVIIYEATCSCFLFALCICYYTIVVAALELAISWKYSSKYERISELKKYFHSFTVKLL